MDWKESLVRFVASYLGAMTAGFAVVVFAVSAWRAYKLKTTNQTALNWIIEQLKDLLSTDVIWILLLIEAVVFFVSAPIFAFTQCVKVGVDYVAYGAPCLAALVAGMAVMFQRAEPNPAKKTTLLGTSSKGSRADAPRKSSEESEGQPLVVTAKPASAGAASKQRRPREYYLYILSLALLAGGYVAYVWLHFAYKTLIWLVIVTCASMAIGFFIPPTRRRMAHPLGASEPATLALGVILVLLTTMLCWFVRAENAVFTGADTSIVEKACKDE